MTASQRARRPATRRIPFRRIAISRLNPTALTGEIRLVEVARRWASHALAKGADALMIRETLPADSWNQVIAELDALRGKKRVALLVNGYTGPDALLDGYHVRENFFSCPERHYPGQLLGKSVHSLEAAQAAEREGYDYLMYSPVFATDSHPEAIPAGLSSLGVICEGVGLPVFALGGVTDANEELCLSAGAHGTAAIGRYA